MTASRGPATATAREPARAAPPPRPWAWRIAAAGLLALMALAVVDTLRHPRVGYEALHPGVPGATPETIAAWLGVMLAEGLIACAWLRARSPTAVEVRALAVAALLALELFGFAVMGPMMMHVGTPVAQHVTWLVFATGWLLTFGLGAGIAGAIARWRAGR